MQYSFRNTLCGLAVIMAAGLLAEQANAQAKDLTGNEEAVALAPATETSIPEEISIFDEEMNDVSLPDNGLISPAQATSSKPSDVIPMEGEAVHENVSLEEDEETFNLDEEDEVTPPLKKEVMKELPANVKDAEVKGKLLADKNEGVFDDNISPSLNKELFTRMSDLEKQTTLLTLELKKEQVQNEIAAVKAQRLKAIQEEETRKQEERRKEQEWRNEQERLRIAEETKLKEAEANLEKLRQEKVIKAYKETLLAETQKWINTNAEVYKKLAEKNKEIDSILAQNKERMEILNQKAEGLKSKAVAAQKAHEKKVANLENQVSILKTRLEAEIESAKKRIAEAQARASGKKNPFATSLNGSLGSQQNATMSSEYAIMEIVGQGEDMAAKLINADGGVFMVKVGTTLRNGYTIDEITKTFISAVKDNEKDLLYFSAGGILDQEPVSSNLESGKKEKKGGNLENATVTKGIPSLSNGMFIK